MEIDYSSLLKTKRFAEEKHSSYDLEAALSSDKSRVIFCSSFRRLQQKTQVFGLETNAAVRSRLTHTLEVANTGGLIAKQIANKLIKDKEIEEELKVPFIDITETCCLLHDIGNPPFGHFGEAAIKKWFKENGENTLINSLGELPSKGLSKKLLLDFTHFDGNPQGIRIILRLQGLPEDKEGNGLNLTYSQILSCVKYNATPEDVENQASKKAGFFFTEEEKVNEIKEYLNWSKRFPITYIMEAADDISYCLSDIEDGIEKGIFDAAFFFKKLFEEWKPSNLENYGLDEKITPTKRNFYRFKIVLTRELTKKAADLFIANQIKIKAGTAKDLFDEDEEAKNALKALKTFSRRHLFRSKEAENIELTGYRVIFGILDALEPLLILSHEKFRLLVEAKTDIDSLTKQNLDIEWRLFNKLPDKHIDAYTCSVGNLEKNKEFKTKEWFLRAHLIVDYISGMTDHFALEIYKLFNGIKF